MKIVKIATLIAAGIVLSALFVVTSYADTADKDYTIASAWWEEKETGHIFAKWEKPKDSTTYVTILYKGDERIQIGTAHSCTASGYNYTRDIVKRGTGTYYFDVYPSKLGPAYTVSSDELVVDSAMLKKAKTQVTTSSTSEKKVSKVDSAIQFLGPGESQNTTGGDRWVQDTKQRWLRQRADGTIYKNQWLQVDGKWYLFDSYGYMQSNGWRHIGRKWYYLDTDGALITGGKTPDGYDVNESGECVKNGQVYTGSQAPYAVADDGKTSLTTNLKQVALLTVSAVETTVEQDKPKRVEIVCSTGAIVDDYSFSIPYEQWKVGYNIKVSVTLTAASGYYFDKTTKYRAGSVMTICTNNGDSTTRKLTLYYTPKQDLSQPAGFYITSDYVLHWDKVPGAYKYEIKIRGDAIRSRTVQTMKNYYDLSEYNGEGVKITVTAKGPDGSNAYKQSKSYVIVNLDEFAEDNTIEGRLRKQDGKYIYTDESGEKADGWVKIKSDWYHFTKGVADGPGWYQDSSDGYWFYFDSECRLVTGKLTEGGKEYFLNDGSRADLPLGAMVQ